MKRLVVCVALLASSLAHAEEPSAMGAAARSCVLPGWGQRAQGQRTKGWIFTGVTAALLAGTAYAYVDAADARADYKKLGVGSTPEQFDRADQRQKETAVLFQLSALATGTWWSYTVLDAALAADPRLEKALHDVDESLGRIPACR